MSTPIQVRTLPIPTGGRLASLTIAGVLMALSARKEVIAPGSPIYDHLLAGRPQALTNAIRLQNVLFYVLYGVHSIEAIFFAATKLRKHGVPFFSALWWKWIALCLVGGAFTWDHFEKTVQATAAKQV